MGRNRNRTQRLISWMERRQPGLPTPYCTHLHPTLCLLAHAPPPPLSQGSQEKWELGVAAKPKITPRCQDLPQQHRSFSCLYAQLSPGPDPRSSLAGDRDGRVGEEAHPLRQFTPCSPLLPHLQGEGTPAVAAK